MRGRVIPPAAYEARANGARFDEARQEQHRCDLGHHRCEVRACLSPHVGDQSHDEPKQDGQKREDRREEPHVAATLDAIRRLVDASV
jgi:hypothetical protein